MAKKTVMVSINRKNKITPTHRATVNIHKGAKAKGVVVLYDEDTNILFEVDEDEDVFEPRTFLAIKLGERLPDVSKKSYLGIAVLQKGHIIEQIYDVTE